VKNALIEFIGTFFVAFVVAIAVGGGVAANIAPFAVFAILVACIYAGRHLSGAVYNPAVTVALWMRGSLQARTLLLFWVAQVAAGVVAAFVAASVASTMPNLTMPAQPFAPDMRAAIIVEFLFTFLMCFVVLQVATTEQSKGNSYYGVAIAMVVLAGALTVGTVSSAVFNPAVGATLVALGHLTLPTYLTYVGAQMAGAVVAGGLFKFTNAGE
jgi:aquaporin Z